MQPTPVLHTLGDIIAYGESLLAAPVAAHAVAARHYPAASQWFVPPAIFKTLQAEYPSERTERPHSGALAKALVHARPTMEHLRMARDYVRNEGEDMSVTVRPPDVYMDALNEFRAAPLRELAELATKTTSPRWVLAGLFAVAGAEKAQHYVWRKGEGAELVPEGRTYVEKALTLYAPPETWQRIRGTTSPRVMRERVRQWLLTRAPAAVIIEEAAAYVQEAHRAAQVGVAHHRPLERLQVYVSRDLHEHIGHQAKVRGVSRQVYVVAAMADMARHIEEHGHDRA